MKDYEQERFFMPVFIDATIVIDLMKVEAIQLNENGMLFFYMSSGKIIDMTPPDPAKTYQRQVCTWTRLHAKRTSPEIESFFKSDQLPNYLKPKKEGESK